MRTRLTWLAAMASVWSCGSSQSPIPAPAPAAVGPTWYRDIEPIVQVNCDGCHVAGGIGNLVFDATTVQGAAGMMAQRVQTGFMPPWPPSTLGPPLVGERRLTQGQIDTIAAWQKNGAPLGDPKDHQDRASNITFDPGRDPDVSVLMDASDAYPPHVAATDDVRCFVIDLHNTSNAWVTALQWVVGSPGAVHHIGGAALDPTQAAAARALYGMDGRPGYDCAGGLRVGGVAGFSATGAGSDTGTMMPAGSGIFIPKGSSLVLSVHYIPSQLMAPDRSGVKLWFAPNGNGLRPMVQYTFNAPSELPCPTGVTTDPGDPCSRAYGIAQVATIPAAETQAANDFTLKKCNTSLDQYYAAVTFNPPVPSHFPIPTQCDDAIPFDGTIQVVHSHMHTRGASSRIEVLESDGSWTPLLDIPTWRWTWEGAYLLQQGVQVSRGQKLRLSCTYDNGTANQWSAATNQPGHDGPAAAPLQPPHYVVAGTDRGDDMCAAFLSIATRRYQSSSFPDACHEAQAIYDGACADHAVDFVAGPCADTIEQYAVELLETPPGLVYPYWCGPKGANAKVGATCDLIVNCSLACAVQNGWSQGVPASCVSACKTNVNAYGSTGGQPATSGSPLADFQLDNLEACAQSPCAGQATWQDYLSCMEVACTDLTKACYGKP